MSSEHESVPLPRGRYVVEALEHVRIAEIEDADGRRYRVPRAWLPSGLREGDVMSAVVIEGDDDARILLALDEAATEARRSALDVRYERLPRAPDGDLDL